MGGEEMTAENSTSDNNPRNVTETVAFFDPTWQLAITIEFYFQYVIIAIGVFGMAANALVLYALVAHHLRESKKRLVNLLMINQNLLDLTCCLLLVVTFSVKVSNIYLTSALGYYLCMLVTSENATQSAMNASIINLAATCASKSLCVCVCFPSRTELKPDPVCPVDFDAYAAARLMTEALIALWVAFSLITSVHR